MRLLSAALLLVLASAFPASAQQWLPGGLGIPIVCAYNASPPTVATGLFIYAQCDTNGKLISSSGGGGGGGAVTLASGAVASGAYASGSIAAGAYSSGSFVAGAMVDGAIATMGTEADSPWVSGSGSEIAILKTIAANAALTIVTNAGTFAVQLTGATNNINNVSGTVSLPTGASTSANQSTEITSLAAIQNLGVGAAALATNHISCPITTETSIVAARTGSAGTGRVSVTITNITGTQVIDLGNTGVTVGNGIELPAIAGASITINTTAAIHCIATTGAQTVSFLETF